MYRGGGHSSAKKVGELWETSESSGAPMMALDVPHPRDLAPHPVCGSSFFIPGLSFFTLFWLFLISLPFSYFSLCPSSSLSSLNPHPSSLNLLSLPLLLLLPHPFSTPTSLILSRFLSPPPTQFFSLLFLLSLPK